jgi:hypothetical protein
MEILFVCNKENDEIYNNFLVPSINRFKFKCLQIGDKENPENTKKSLTEKYNIVCNIIKEKNLLTKNDVVIFCHEDVNILDNFFNEKIKMIFEQKPEVGIVGIVGTEIVDTSGFWMEDDKFPRGHIVMGENVNDPGKGKHEVFGTIGYYDDIVNVDNCFFAVRYSLFEQMSFDTNTLIDDNYFYAADICMQCLKLGFKIAVSDIMIFHNSDGIKSKEENEEYKKSKDLFFEKYNKFEYPISINNFEFDNSEILNIEI